MNENTKLTSGEKRWIMYDVGNSAFTLFMTTVIPLYFAHLASQDGISSTTATAYWGWIASAATIIVALIGPILGTITDFEGLKKPIFTIAVLIGVGACFVMMAPMHWILFVIVFMVAKVAYSASLIFYDSMLTDVTTKERFDNVSSMGYALGYIGSCVPFILSLVFVNFIPNLPFAVGMAIAFAINGIWWLVFTIPHLRTYEQKHFIPRQPKVVRASFKRLGNGLKEMSKNKGILLFLIAFFFYIDGVYTIIDMAVSFGDALGLASDDLLIALLATQVVAFPCAIIFGKLAKKVASDKLIMVCITAYIGIALYAIFLKTIAQFWILAICVGMFQGAVQALSRSYFARIIPAEKSGEYFGVYDIFGKGAAFLGTFMVATITMVLDSTVWGNNLLASLGLQAVNLGVASLVLLFVAGLITFILAAKANRASGAINTDNART